MLPCCALVAFVVVTALGWLRTARRGLRRAGFALAIALGGTLGLGSGVALAAYVAPTSQAKAFCLALFKDSVASPLR